MGHLIRSLFEPSELTPHGFCLLWEPGLIWLHTVSDLLIALSYFSIPIAMVAFLRRRPDIEFGWLVWLFAAFILFCGTTHVLSILTLWQPYYWLEGSVKAATAGVSLVTAILLWPLLPRLTALPSPSALREANAALERQVAERNTLVRALERREAELTELAATLERRVAERTESLAAVNRRFETALAASGVTVFTQDENLVFTWISKGELGRPAGDVIGRADAEILPEPPRSQVLALKRGVLESGQPARAEVQAGERWFDVIVEPLREAPGLIGGAVDITAQKASEARIRFLHNEVTHRVGNLLAVVHAVLRQTAKGAATVEELAERFDERLRSMAQAQQLLMREGAQRATLDEVARSQLAPFRDEQIELAGPPVPLENAAVLHIGMALHELATNAAKYGALSVPGGRVRLAWERTATECVVSWRESGGPRVRPSSRRGFGRDVIEWAVASAVGGAVELAFPEDGVTWDLRFPLASA
ncbi:histidine kinase [Roseococcus sp. SYP-B2431]|uniref:sensor histidine kinase n=1 Tax=Roseococcus sp. SYP-B2431 TaxID=2496640 RepID=UPI00103BB30B|nr:PAS domain-containing sensor histidine kinase [Roseococcus sp. SYP-B2431]TCH99924.1 histidine kinase [Roseococcus sp. SYP-B2431]